MALVVGASIVLGMAVLAPVVSIATAGAIAFILLTSGRGRRMTRLETTTMALSTGAFLWFVVLVSTLLRSGSANAALLHPASLGQMFNLPTLGGAALRGLVATVGMALMILGKPSRHHHHRRRSEATGEHQMFHDVRKLRPPEEEISGPQPRRSRSGINLS